MFGELEKVSDLGRENLADLTRAGKEKLFASVDLVDSAVPEVPVQFRLKADGILREEREDSPLFQRVGASVPPHALAHKKRGQVPLRPAVLLASEGADSLLVEISAPGAEID
jgi:hypothetical protein